MVLDLGENCMEQANGGRLSKNVSEMLEPEPSTEKPKAVRSRTTSITQRDRPTHNGPCTTSDSSSRVHRRLRESEGRRKGETAQPGEFAKQAPCRRPLSLEIKPQRVRAMQQLVPKVIQPPWRSGGPSPPMRSLTSPSLGPGNWLRRSESTCTMNSTTPSRAGRVRMRPATSLPHIARGLGSLPSPSTPRGPCLLVALRPINMEQERETFFRSNYEYEPQFEYSSPEPSTVLEKYREGSGLFLSQAVRIMECVLRKYGTYENFEEVTGGNLLPKSQVWAATRKYLQKEGCVGEVVVSLSDELLSQAVMQVERCRPTLTINLSGARQHWLEGMLRHEIGTHYLRGVNNSLQPWATSVGRMQFGLKPANPTEEGLASLHSVLLRKQPFLWRAALLYYTVYHATNMSFSQLFSHIARFVQDPAVRWEYCLRAKRGQTDTSKPGCFSKDQVYLDGILKILRHRRNIDFKILTSLGKVSYEDVDRLRHLAVLNGTRIPHFMQDEERYLQHLDNIVTVNELNDAELQELIP
ncbi:microtubule-associated tyrosine carboxypeptidase isoform X1 [Myxocyprinus asiaticus]|uniref:microtubule-associated tyrosine carboxypeptidase isoform X1 n=2 Tax=Myxocyprinus asiaticus TaxID=70543 RepID=UPI0022217CD6|nr:microtubule-associated tyrosine carboxypeptidase isoform X1 [Myxocyprinus asiaticus]